MIDATTTYGLSTTNTSSQNKNALYSAIKNEAGRTIYVPDGIYPIDPIVISVPHTILQLAPEAMLMVSAGTTLHPMLINIDADDVTVDGGILNGSSVAGISGIMAIRITGSHNRIVIRNITVINSSVGIGSYNGRDCSDWLIEKCTIEGTVKSHGIYLHGHPTNNKLGVSNVRVHHNTINGAQGNGIWAGNGFNNVSISGNQISNVERIGIEVWTNRRGYFVITDNIINVCKSFGISIAGTPYTVCNANIINDVKSYGIEVANSKNVSLVGNHINNVSERESGVKTAGIVLNSSVENGIGEISIQGGTIAGCLSGINVCGAKDRRGNISIVGVVIKDCTYGIRNIGNIGKADGGGMVENLTITGCAIRAAAVGIGNSVNGGLIRGAAIVGNNIHVDNGDGIDMFRPAETIIADNRLHGEGVEGTVGIRLRDHTKGTLRAHDIIVGKNMIIGFETPHVYNVNIKNEMIKNDL